MKRTARIGTEKDLSSLVRALFVPKGAFTPQLQRRAERALIAANPGLRRNEAFVPGMEVVVPEIEGLDLSDRVEKGAEGIEGALQDAEVRLRNVQAAIVTGVRAAEGRRKSALALLDDDRLRRTVEKLLPDNAPLLERAAQNLRKEEEQSEVEAKRLGEAAQRAVEALDALSLRLPDPPKR